MDGNTINQNFSLRTVNEGIEASIRENLSQDKNEEDRMQQLSMKLQDENRQEDEQRALCDEDYRQALYHKYQI